MKGFNGRAFYEEFMSTLALEIKERPGVVEFVEDILFNGDIKLHVSQRAILKSFYREELDDIEKETLLQWKEEIGPYKVPRTNWVEGRKYNSLALEVGRRGGKSVIGAILALREFHNLILYDNPSQHYGLLPSEPIAIFIFSQTLQQSKKTLFSKITGWLRYSNYFKELEKTGKIEILQEEVRCTEKNVSIMAVHSNSQSLVGYALKLMVCDEFARWDDLADGHNVGMEDIWKNVGKGTITFGDEGYKVAISSAWADKDNIQKLVEGGEKDPSRLTFNLRTWDVNPIFNQTNALVRADYLEDYETAVLEYEGVRKDGRGNFLPPSSIESVELLQTAMDFSPIDTTLSNEAGVRHYVSLLIDRLAFHEGPSFAHMDYGVKKDSAALAVCHMEGNIIYVDGYAVWHPYIDKEVGKRVVDFHNVYEVLLSVCRERNVKLMTFDSFQSQAAIQELHREGIRTEEMSTSRVAQYDYYCLFRKRVNEGLIKLPMDSPWTILTRTQFGELTVRKRQNGNSLHHGSAGKDLMDAIVNCTYNCHNYHDKSSDAVKAGVSVVSRPHRTTTNKLNTDFYSRYIEKKRKELRSSRH